MHASLEPPYLSASAGSDRMSTDDEYFEFLIGDTPTPVPSDRSIPFDIMVKIAKHFYNSEAIPKWVEWIED
jgi:hypothetical protein